METTNDEMDDARDTRSSEQTQLEELFLDSIKDMYWAEKHLTKAIPKLIKKATSEELKQALESHLEVTKAQVTKLEKVFGLLDKKPQTQKCDAMNGLTKEADTIVSETEDGSMTRDAGIILAAQKVEHYEIATYGTLTRLAKTMDRQDVADVLAEILQEEKDADHALTEVAENHVNLIAKEEA